MNRDKGWKWWGLGCLLDMVLIIVAVAAMDSDRGASFLLYMMILSIPVAFVRKMFFTEATPRWLRVSMGPAGALVCLAVAWFFPFARSGTPSKGPADPGRAAEVSPKAPAAAVPTESVEAVLAELDALVGLEDVKAEVRRVVNLAKINEARRKEGLKVPPVSYHMVFTGNPGTGKTTVARLVARAFAAIGVVRKRTVVETDRSGLVGRYAGETAVKTAAKCDEALDGVLFIDEAYQLVEGDNDSYGREAIATLLKRMEDDRGRLVVIAAGYTDEMRDFLNANSGLRSRFTREIEFADYTSAELASIFRAIARKNQFKLAPDLEAGLADAIDARLARRRDRTFGNARAVRQLFEDAVGRQANRLAAVGTPDGAALATLTLADVRAPERKNDVRAPTIESVLAELDALTGMKPVKDEVRRLIATVRANKLRAEQGVAGAVPMSYNFVFTGNPGTGKTTVARILGKAFRALGLLERGNFVETDRSGLVAKYAGQTAPKTNKLIDSALGGVLFIDEAYQLNQGANDTFGSEAVATLLKRMEDARGSLVVIIAGYKDEMKRFMAINSGLESRFNRTVDFPDFTTKELAQIFRSMAKKGHYVLSPDLEKWIEPYIGLCTRKKTKAFGNARWVRNLFEKTLERQALRVVELSGASKEELVTLRLKDAGISLKDPDASQED